MLQLESNPRAMDMRNVSIQEFEEHPADFFAEVEAGSRLTIVRGGKAVVTMSPVRSGQQENNAKQEAARRRLLAIMDQGIDLGGTAPSRDEMHEPL